VKTVDNCPRSACQTVKLPSIQIHKPFGAACPLHRAIKAPISISKIAIIFEFPILFAAPKLSMQHPG
jgi:hypothetical protein